MALDIGAGDPRPSNTSRTGGGSRWSPSRPTKANQPGRRRRASHTTPSAPAPRRAPTPSGGGAPSAPAGNSDLERFLYALRMHESNNRNVNNKGGHSSASGYYQYIDGTWNGYGGYSRAIDAPFEVQHRKAMEDARRAYQKYGDWERVAMAHFYPALADNPKSEWNRVIGKGNPAAKDYVSMVMSRFSPSRTNAANPVPGGPAGGGLPAFPTPQVPTYPTTPAPLTSEMIASIAERRGLADRRYGETLASTEAQKQRLESQFEMFKSQLGRKQGQAKRELGNELGARGLAFQPRFMGRGLRDLRNQYAESMAMGEADMAERVAALEEAIRVAELDRDTELAAIDRDKARFQSRLDSLLSALGG